MQKLEQKQLYKKKGQMQGAVGAVITLIVGIGVSVLILIFVGALGGQTYNLVESDITEINNTTVQNHVRNSIVSGFQSLETAGDYLPIIVLAVVIAIVLALVLSFGGLASGGGRGSAL